jgi:hypothetical protein
VYEGLTPTVRAGQEVLAGQRIGTFYPGSSIEIGWSDASGAPLAHDVYTEGMVTQQGRDMWKFLHSIGSGKGMNNQFSELLAPKQWQKVAQRIGNLPTPSVSTEPSKYSVPAGKRHHK